MLRRRIEAATDAFELAGGHHTAQNDSWNSFRREIAGTNNAGLSSKAEEAIAMGCVHRTIVFLNVV
jgi:hypothetical protein